MSERRTDERRTDGHCDHCGVGCEGGKPNPSYFGEKTPHVLDDRGLTSLRWVEGACPACAERKRIVAWLMSESELRQQHGWRCDVEVSGALEFAAQDILDGKHLENGNE